MSGRGGRERFRRDHPSRYEDKSISTGRSNSNSNNPPSRHLWVGNLPHNIVEDEVAHHFLQFGPLESVAFQPGRSYAFINFKRDEDAIDALKALQGFPLAGNPLRIEFAKADKPLMVSRDEDSSWDERSPVLRESAFSQREFRGRHGSPEPLYSDKSKLSDKNPEPSEVLWIGFPSQLKVDEFTLRKAFSPFGEIEKITTFPGRSYAFVRFRSLMSACRAKETLQGKLFGNPRVHICFAKSDTGSSSGGRNSINAPPSPFYKPSGRQRSPESLRQDRNFVGLSGDHSISPPQFFPNWDPGDSDAYDFNGRGSSWAGGTNTYEQRRVGEKGPPLGISREIYDHSSSPSRDRLVHLGDFPQRFPLKGALFEDPRNFPEDVHYLHEAKRIKTGSFPLEDDIPDYPLSDLGRQKHVFPRILSDFSQLEAHDKSFDAGSFAYRQTPDHMPNSPTRSDRIDHWQPHDSFQMGPGALQSNSVEKRKLTPESKNVSANEWKWEGTIAKGGTPVCRARCFPVGKVLDILLPEFLDCTARTGLDMLSKHYYQAAGAWVVFFVPESDTDIGFYNEFMHYLEEKQRAAVAKLDDKTTLFLVPPSDFSEKVLKVPGKLSISGVILRLEHPGSNHGPMHDQKEIEDAKSFSYHGDTFYPKPSVPSALFPPSTSVPELGNSGMSNLSFLGNKMTSAPPTSVSGSACGVVSISESRDERRHDYPNPIQLQNPMSGPNWSSPHLQNLISNRTLPLQVSNGGAESIAQERQQFMHREVPDANSSQRTGGISGIPLSGNSKSPLQQIRPMDSSSMSAGALQPEQLAQLASLLGQRRQSGSSQGAATLDDPRQINRVLRSDSSSRPSQKYAVENNPVKSELSTSQFGQVLQLQKQQQMSNVPQVPQVVHREPQRGASGNQQMMNSSLQEDAAEDPQKRLQATLQLAAVLLQQIQQGK